MRQSRPIGGMGLIGLAFVAGVPVDRCFADFDQNGTLSPQDIFSLLSAYFAANLDADTNGSNTLSPDDIFAFLTTYFTGC